MFFKYKIFVFLTVRFGIIFRNENKKQLQIIFELANELILKNDLKNE